LIQEPHATVDGTERGLRASGWKRISKPRIGAVIIWEPVTLGGEGHRHIGVYVGERKAISNSRSRQSPRRHHWTYGTKKGRPNRRVERIYWHPKLGK
jgi:hypothetical protein